MNCTQCQGVMREKQFFDVDAIPGLMWIRGWRCMDCGHAVNPLLEANRRLNAVTLQAFPQEEPAYQGEEVHLEADRMTRVAV